MSAAALKERLRADLKAALQARASHEVSLLRALIAAVDNAEAVPAEYDARSRAFGDPSGEVARRDLDGPALDALLAEEVEARLASAAVFEEHRRGEDAARLRAEAALVARYRV